MTPSVIYLVDQAISPFFFIFVVFMLDELDRDLPSNLCKILNGEKINGSKPEPEKQRW